MFTHSIYENIRVSVIIVHDGKMLLHAPCQAPAEGRRWAPDTAAV